MEQLPITYQFAEIWRPVEARQKLDRSASLGQKAWEAHSNGGPAFQPVFQSVAAVPVS